AVNDVTTGKPLTITLPDTSSKAFWSGTGKSETFHPETYKRQVKEAIKRACVIAGIGVEVK
ncbi:ATPase, partial [Salmonella enterica]|nr:ATPase [Salmonella enterica]EAZ0469790.1 ATPase [Salmonella enterica]